MTSPRFAGQVLSFAREGHRFVLPAARIAEVIEDRAVEPVPLAPAAVKGLLLDRGRVLTVIELDRLLQVEPGREVDSPRSEERATCLLLLAAPFAHLALRVAAPVRFCGPSPDLPGGEAEVLEIERVVETIEAVMRRGAGAA